MPSLPCARLINMFSSSLLIHGHVVRRHPWQAAYDAALDLNCLGKGLQLHRAECFTWVCRALVPGDEDVHESLQNAVR